MARARIPWLLLGLGLGLGLIATAPAFATIVPQQGIAGVRLGMSEARVRGLLGRPNSVHRGSNDFGRFTELGYTGLRITFQGGNAATNISTTRTSERTAGGVGIGSPESSVRARVHGVRCRTEFGFRHCFLGRFLAGRRVTDFVIRHGRVSRVDVGFVVD